VRATCITKLTFFALGLRKIHLVHLQKGLFKFMEEQTSVLKGSCLCGAVQ
jgi:hypothetical protein